MFVGLDVLADTALVSSGRFVRAISDSGIKKIDRNIAAVQQALRNMLSAGSRIVLSSCRRYWKLYAIGPQVSLFAFASSFSKYSRWRLILALSVAVFDLADSAQRPRLHFRRIQSHADTAVQNRCPGRNSSQQPSEPATRPVKWDDRFHWKRAKDFRF